MDANRRRQILRLATEYVDRKDQGEPVTWGPKARITRLDADGNPSGPTVAAGPFILSTTPDELPPAATHRMPCSCRVCSL